MKRVIEIIATVFLCGIVFIVLVDLGIIPKWVGSFFTGFWLIFYLLLAVLFASGLVRYGVKSLIRRFSREKDPHRSP